jgi:hypothetical protein
VATGAPVRMAHALAAFIAGFGLVKLASGARVFAERVVAGGDGIGPAIGDPRLLALWVGFRVLVGVVALTVAAWLLADPDAADRLMPH